MTDELGPLIRQGDIAGVRAALAREPALANQTIRWFLNQENASDPLHFVSDCVGQGWLTNGSEGAIAEALLEHGAAIEGTEGRESPLIAAASLGAEAVAKVLVEAGAQLEATSVFGARALHWAAWVGSWATVELLVAHKAEIDPRCSEFGATPLFWAVHGLGPDGPTPKRYQVAVARMLVRAGARVDTANKQGVSAMELAVRGGSAEMVEVLGGKA